MWRYYGKSFIVDSLTEAKVIDVYVPSPEELFETSPVSGQATLIQKYSDYVLLKARDIEIGAPIAIRVISERAGDGTILSKKIRTHYHCQFENEKKELKLTRRYGFLFLMVGFAIAMAMVLLSAFLKEMTQTTFLKSILESLGIFGTVALWRPAEILLYEWIPHYKKIRLLERLSSSKTTVQIAKGE